MQKQIFDTLSQIRAIVWGVDYTQRPAVMYHLDEKPPFARVAYPNGDVYHIHEDGVTTKKIAGLDIPWQGCPYPEAIETLCISGFFWKNRKRIPVAFAVLLAIVSLNFLLSLTDAGYHRTMITGFAALMNYTLFISSVAVIAVAFIWNFGKGRRFQIGQDEDILMLSAGDIDLSPDIIIMSRSEADIEQGHADRIKQARLDMLPRGQYLVVFTFRCPAGIIVRFPDTGSQEVFGRANLTKDIPGWTAEVCDPRRFDLETYSDFVRYVHCFCDQFRGWAQVDKMKQGTPLRDLIHTVEASAKVAATCLLLFFASFAGAQSAQPIPQSAGQSIFRSVPDSAKLESYKLEMLKGKAEIGQEIRPRLAFVMWTFHNWVVPVLFLIGLLAWFWAKAAFRESEHDQGGNVVFGIGIAGGGHHARRIVFLLAAAIAVVEIADTMITSFFASENLWWAAIKSVAYAVAWMYLVNWITPNPKVKATSNLPMAGNQYQRLNG